MDSPGPLVFFGTPEFAVPSLERLAASRYRPSLVVSQPSRPSGRGRKLHAPPVARRAAKLGLSCVQIGRVRSEGFLERMEALAPWVGVVVAFGQIFPRRLLEIPAEGCINVHGSLLPKYRGAAPIQAAIAAGDVVTGVTTQRMAKAVDSGPIFLERQIEIGADETAPELAARLATAGADLLLETLEGIAEGAIAAQAQDETEVSVAPRLEKKEGEVDWNLSVASIYNRYRAYQPWPGLSSVFRGEAVKIVECHPSSRTTGVVDAIERSPGTVLSSSPELQVVCGDGGVLVLDRLQRPSRRALSGLDFANGEHVEIGDRFGSL